MIPPIRTALLPYRPISMASSSLPAQVDNAYLNALIQLRRAGPPPDDLIPGAPSRSMSGMASSRPPVFARQGGSVIAQAVKDIFELLKRETGLGTPEPEADPHPGIQHIAHSKMKQLKQPKTRDAGYQLMLESQSAQMEATKAYETTQLDRMTDEIRAKYWEAQGKVVAAYQAEKPAIDAYLAKIEQVGRPDPGELNQAKWELDQAVRRSEYLKGRGIGVLEFQIMRARHDLEAWEGTAEEKQFLKTRVYGQERIYVIEILIHQVTQMLKEGRPESEWQPIEDLAMLASEVFDRLVEGKTLEKTDLQDLARLRAIAFPFEIDWVNPALQIEYEANDSVWVAVENFHHASKKFAEASHHFIKETALVARARNQAAEHASMAREQADFEFQLFRIQSEFDRLTDFVQSNGQSVATEDQMAFQESLKDYREAYEAHRAYWRDFIEGNDPDAREHGRNAKDKDTLFNLCFGAQWCLFELYEKYKVCGVDGNEIRPSCLSFSYNNAMRGMADAVNNGTISRKGIEEYFHKVWRLGPTVFQEIGLTIPMTRIKLGGRRIADNNVLDTMAAGMGSYSFGDHQSSIDLYGLENMVHLLTQQPPHPGVMNLAGAMSVYPEEFKRVTDVSHQGILLLPNHTGITEFLLMIRLSLWGIHAPQQAQQGLAVIPIFGDYIKARSVILDRRLGSGVANQKIIDFLMREAGILSYAAGTRIVTPGGGHPYMDYKVHPSEVLAYRIPTDRQRSGQVSKIALQTRKMAGQTGHDFLVVTVVQNGSLIVREPTWFLGEEPVQFILGNLSPKTQLNMRQWGIPDAIGFGQVLSSDGYLSVDEMRASLPEHFDGLRDRQSYIETLQLNEAPMIADQADVAARMGMTPDVELSAEQWAEQRRLSQLSVEERERQTDEPMDRHLRARRGLIQTAQALYRRENDASLSERDEAIAKALAIGDMAKMPKAPRRRQPLTSLSNAEMNDLQSRAGLEDDEVKAILGEGFEIDVPGKRRLKRRRQRRAEESLSLLKEAVLRGAAVARAYQAKGLTADAVALDLDKVVWDHFFTLGAENTGELLEGEVMERLGGPKSNASLTEHINLNPQWVAFIKGYCAAVGAAPVLFSSSLGARLQLLAKHVDKNPLLKTFLEAILGEKNLSSETAEAFLSADKIVANPRIIVRTKIANHVSHLMERFRANDHSLGGTQSDGKPIFSDDERIDVGIILRTGGDTHLKYRSMMPYAVLVDDRKENCREATHYKGVTVIQPEPWTIPAGRLYVVSSAETDIAARLNQGRSAQALEVMRMMDSLESDGRHVILRRQNRALKIAGLRDFPVAIQYSREVTNEEYVKPQATARKLVNDAIVAIFQKADEQRRSHMKVKAQLSALFKECFGDPNDSLFVEQDIPKKLLESTLKLLNAKGGKKGSKEIKQEADFDQLETVAHAIPDDSRRTEVLLLIGRLNEREAIAIQEDYLTKRRTKGLKKVLEVVGQVKKLFTRDVPAAGNALGTSLQHIGATEMKAELTGWGLVRNAIPWQNGRPSRDGWKLLRLGRYLESGETNMSLLQIGEGFSIAVERIAAHYAKAVLTSALTDKRVDEDIRAELLGQEKELMEKIDRQAALLRKVVYDAAKIIEGAVNLYSDGSDFISNFNELLTGPVVTAAQDVVRYEIQRRLDIIAEHRKEKGLSDPDVLVDRDPHTAFAYRLIGGLQTLVGEETAFGELLAEVQHNLLDVGLEEWLQVAFQIPRRVMNLVKDRDAKSIAHHLSVEGNADQAELLLLKKADYLLARNPETAVREFRAMAEASWTFTDPAEHDQLKAIVHRVYTRLFGQTDGTNPVDSSARLLAAMREPPE